MRSDATIGVAANDEDLIKDMNLTNQFMHLYRHTDFALTDFIYVRDFYSEINIEIKKGTF